MVIWHCSAEHGLSGKEMVREPHPLLGEGQDDGVRARGCSDVDEAHVRHSSDPVGGVGVAGDVAVDGGLHASGMVADVEEYVQAVGGAEEGSEQGAFIHQFHHVVENR